MSDLKKNFGKLSKYKYPIIILLVGIILLSLPSGQKMNSSSVSTDAELRFEKVLESSAGVGNAKVLISDSGVVVVCDGADSPSVKLSVLKATEVFTGYSSEKIQIIKTAD